MMRVSDEKTRYLSYYFDNIHFQGKLQVDAVKEMAESKGQEAEFVSCSFDPNDEDYMEGHVTLLFWKPADDEDTMVFVENMVFYDYLLTVCNDHMTKTKEKEEAILGYLREIKGVLNV